MRPCLGIRVSERGPELDHVERLRILPRVSDPYRRTGADCGAMRQHRAERQAQGSCYLLQLLVLLVQAFQPRPRHSIVPLAVCQQLLDSLQRLFFVEVDVLLLVSLVAVVLHLFAARLDLDDAERRRGSFEKMAEGRQFGELRIIAGISCSVCETYMAASICLKVVSACSK